MCYWCACVPLHNHCITFRWMLLALAQSGYTLISTPSLENDHSWSLVQPRATHYYLIFVVSIIYILKCHPKAF